MLARTPPAWRVVKGGMARRRVSGSGTVVDGREPVGPSAYGGGGGTVPPVVQCTHDYTHTRAHVSRRFVARSAVSSSPVRVILSCSSVVYNNIIILYIYY